MENLKEELDFINKLKEAMEFGLKREVFMPEIIKVKYYINHQSQFLKLNKSDVKFSFSELSEMILKHKAKSEYKQASIVILRNIFEENGI